MEENPPSVRIEFEERSRSNGGVPLDEDTQRDPTGGRSLALLGVGVVAALVSLYTVLQPNDGLTAAGTPRVAPATTSGLVAALDSSTTTSEPVIVPPLVQLASLEDTTGASELAEMVEDGLVFLGIGWGDRNGDPVILRSADGQTWQEVNARLRGVEDVPRHDRARHFSALISTDSGFGLMLLETNFFFGGSGESAGETTRIIRLVSERGAIWTVDPDFEILEVDGRPSVFGHDENSFGFVDFRFRTNVALQGLLDGALVEGARPDGVCWAEPLGAESAPQLRLLSCQDGTERIVTPNELQNPDDATSIFDCASSLNMMSGGAPEAVVVDRNVGTSALTEPGTLVAPPVLLDDGRAAALVAGPLRANDIEDCEGLVDLTPTAPAVLHWADGELVGRFPVPPDIAATQDMFSVRSAPVAQGDGIRLALGDALWDISLIDGTWSRVADLPSQATGVFDVHLEADTGLVLGIDDGALSLWEDGATEWSSLPFARRLDDPSIMYRQDGLVIVRHGGEPLIIRLA